MNNPKFLCIYWVDFAILFCTFDPSIIYNRRILDNRLFEYLIKRLNRLPIDRKRISLQMVRQ